MSERVLPEVWTLTSIDQVSIKGEQRKPDSAEQFTYVDIGSIDREKKTIATAQQLFGSDAPSRARKVIRAGDVLVSLTRPNLNAVALVGKEYDEQIASTGFEVIRPVGMDSRFLYYLVRSKAFVDAISGRVQGALYPAAKSHDVKNYQFSLPPAQEQRSIANKLDEMLAQVNNLKARLDAIPDILKRFRQSVLAAAVSGKLGNETFEDGDLKSRTIKFEDVLKNKKNLSYGVLKPGEFESSGVPMIRVMDIGDWGRFRNTEVFRISQSLSLEFKRTIVDEGDVVLSVMATIGRPAIVPASLAGANVNRALAVIKLSDKVISKYVLLQLLSPFFQEAFVDKQIGSAQKRINLSDLRKFDIWVPGIHVQNEIVRRVDELFAFADQVEKQVEAAQSRVNKLTQSILAKAFRGELTADWRAENPELISGEHSAEALLARIKAEKEKLEPAKSRRKRKPASESVSC